MNDEQRQALIIQIGKGKKDLSGLKMKLERLQREIDKKQESIEKLEEDMDA